MDSWMAILIASRGGANQGSAVVRIAVIMDTIEIIDVDRDTSFALMLEFEAGRARHRMDRMPSRGAENLNACSGSRRTDWVFGLRPANWCGAAHQQPDTKLG